MQFVNALLPRNLIMFGGPDPLKISKAIDSKCQSIEYARTRAAGRQTLEKAGFKMAWEGSNFQTVSSKVNLSTPFSMILTVKTPQARNKPAHLSY